MLSYDKYIEYLIKDGEFDHKVNQPFKSFVSGLLDLTIIKPIIEVYTGTDLITGEDLTDLERCLKGVGAVIDILTLGQAMTIAKGAEAGISKMLKTVAVEGLSNVAGYTAAEISNAYDMPPLVSMIVSLGAGITASKVGCKYIIKDSSGKVIQEISEEVARNIDNTSNTTSIKENILKNVEESRIAREASGYKNFIEFENGLGKGVSNTEISRIDYLRNKYGTLTSEQINNRINLRQVTHDKLNELIERELRSGMSKKKIQNKLGPAIAGVYDPVTGKYYFGINNLNGELPENLHNLLKTNYINMPTEGIFAEYNNFTLGAGSHAEIYALNEALIERELMGIPVKNLGKLTLTVLKGPKCGWKKMGMPMPRCPHCEYITGNVNYFPEVLKYAK